MQQNHLQRPFAAAICSDHLQQNRPFAAKYAIYSDHLQRDQSEIRGHSSQNSPETDQIGLKSLINSKIKLQVQKIFRKLLKLKGTHESLLTAWELSSILSRMEFLLKTCYKVYDLNRDSWLSWVKQSLILLVCECRS